MKGQADGLPPTAQATPFHTNRWILLSVYAMQVVVTGCVYFGWAPLSSLLLSAGVFAFKCPTDEAGKFFVDKREEGKVFICDEQDAAVQHLYTITLAVHFGTSALAGCLMDTLGPKVTCMLGQIFNASGWLFLSSLTPESHAAVYFGFVLIGMGADTAFLPTLLISRLFPHCPGLVITLLGAASSVSFVVPLVLWSLLPSGEVSGCMWYACFGPGLFFVIAAFMMPLKPFKAPEKEKQKQISQSPHVSVAMEGDSFLHRTAISAHDKASGLATLSAGTSTTENTGSSIIASASIFRSMISERYVLIVMYFIGVSWVSAFYQESHSRLLADGPQKFLGWMLPLSFVPCVLLGRCSDWTGILPVMAVVNASGVLSYLCSLSSNAGSGYASVLFFMVYMSLFSSQVFVYVGEAFPASHFGRLVGTIELIGGLISLICNPVYTAAVKSQDGHGILRVQVFLIVLMALEFVVIGRLMTLQRKAHVAAGPLRRPPSIKDKLPEP
ncbi:hypothetical protein cyc_06171 [Cyclospora cayetanensis]|uniref:Uncharacterized protein n=1 Tax=Cyclospora cayetanensis TaxID=88456 RepID=A0A1D3CSG8_9EIME|nr:hypothetical protein cyc_06171 [Cyclospora cayetanensis]